MKGRPLMRLAHTLGLNQPRLLGLCTATRFNYFHALCCIKVLSHGRMHQLVCACCLLMWLPPGAAVAACCLSCKHWQFFASTPSLLARRGC